MGGPQAPGRPRQHSVAVAAAELLLLLGGGGGRGGDDMVVVLTCGVLASGETMMVTLVEAVRVVEESAAVLLTVSVNRYVPKHTPTHTQTDRCTARRVLVTGMPHLVAQHDPPPPLSPALCSGRTCLAWAVVDTPHARPKSDPP